MSFFNKNEDVMKFVFTEHGKQQYAKGTFAPKYYSFLDDNIIYNTQKCGYTEEQNRKQERIFETPFLQSVIPFYDIPISIGDSIVSESASFIPRWDIIASKGKISTYSNLFDDKYNENIPQIYMESSSFLLTLDGTKVTVDKDHLFFDIVEHNTDFENYNFTLELFTLTDNEIGNITWELIEFVDDDSFYDYIENDEQQTIFFLENQKKIATTYLTILADDEIDEDILCQYNIDPTLRKGFDGAFSYNPDNACQMKKINKVEEKTYSAHDPDACVASTSEYDLDVQTFNTELPDNLLNVIK